MKKQAFTLTHVVYFNSPCLWRGSPKCLWQKPRSILCAVLRAARGKVAVSGAPNCPHCCVMFMVSAQFTNLAAGRITQRGGPRVGSPWLTAFKSVLFV
jgi:hypothetical protein